MGIELRPAYQLSMLLLAGCAALPPSSTHGDVTLTPVEPPDAAHHVQAAGEKFEIGQIVPDSRRNPDYPAALLSRRLPQVPLCVELSIDTGGRVTHTTILVAPPRCEAPPPDIAEPLKTAVDAAVLRWEFLPSYVCSRPPGAEDDGYCADDDPTRIALPMLRAYRFVFSQHPDGPSVLGEDAAAD